MSKEAHRVPKLAVKYDPLIIFSLGYNIRLCKSFSLKIYNPSIQFEA
jgi:hypothetical protein